MFKKSIKLILLSSIFYSQLELHAFSMNSDVDDDKKGPVVTKLLEHARQKFLEDVTAAKGSDLINTDPNKTTVFVKNNKQNEIKLIYIKTSDLNTFKEDLPRFTLPIQFK